MKKKIVKYEISYCNSLCSQFYHNYEDHENCWCAALNRKMFNCGVDDNIFNDLTEREIPDLCPLENI